MDDPASVPDSESRAAPSPEATSQVTRSPLQRGRRTTLAMRVFTLLGVFGLLPLVVTNVGGYLQTRSVLTAAGLREVRNSAGMTASQLSNLLDSHRRELATLVREDARFLGLVSRASRCGTTDSCHDVQRELEALLAEDVSATPEFVSIVVMSPSGAILASSRPGRASEDDSAVALCFASSQRATRIVSLRSQRGVDLVVGSPLYEQARSVGVACGRFRVDPSALAARAGVARSLVLDERGRVVAGSGAELGAAPRAGARLGPRPWEGRYEVGDEGEVLAAWAPIPELGWGVLAEQPLSVALADLDALRTQALAFGALLAIVLMFVASMAATRVTRPLVRLADAAKRTASGELGVRIPTEGSREVEDSARAFNRMGTALKRSYERLEERIAERTTALARSQEFLELLLNSLDQQVLVVDAGHLIVKANRPALALYGNDIVGRNIAELVEDRTGPCPVGMTFETGEPQTMERPQRILDQLEIVRAETYPVLGPDGRVEAVLEIDRVVTRETQLQAQMVHQEKMATFGLLAAGIAHDMGNPLASIQAQLRMTRAAASPENSAVTLEIVEKEVARMARLLRNLVTFARKRRDDVMLLDVAEVVAGVAGLLSHDPRARSVQVRCDAGAEPAAVRAKEDDLVQVLLNLGVNALDATCERGGTVVFETRTTEGEVAVRVRDTGGGVPDAIRGRLFEPFFTTKPAGRGTGLGLFVSRSVAAEGLGGKLELESSGPDGTVFVLRVPREMMEPEGANP